jgi:hypothetical protein
MRLAPHPSAKTIGLAPTAKWSDILRADTPMVVEGRDITPLTAIAADMLKSAPFSQLAEGSVAAAVDSLTGIALPLRRDIEQLAGRFSALMGCDSIRLRLEGVVSDACRKIHGDYTDVRLITTYAGPGTQYIPHCKSGNEAELVDMPTGWIGLFKGRDFNPGHAPCMHRSPPIIASGERRLVLVIDTPLRSADG